MGVRLSAFLIVAIALCGCDRAGLGRGLVDWPPGDEKPEPPAPDVFADLVMVSGDAQLGDPGSYLPGRLVVRALNSEGQGMSGVAVIFELIEGDGRVVAKDDVAATDTYSTSTNASGEAWVELVLGSEPGETRVTASTVEPDRSVIFTAAVTGGPLVSTGDFALSFVSDLRQEVDVGLVTTTGDQYTVEAWIKIPEHRSYLVIVGQNAGPPDCKGSLDLLGGRLRMLIATQDGSMRELRSSTSVPLDTWTHVAGVYDGVHMRVYIDADLYGEIPLTGNITANNRSRGTFIGGYAGSAGDDGFGWFGGLIDEVRIWDVARSQQQLQDDMGHTIEAQPGLIGYWHFDEGDGMQTKDHSDSGHLGKLGNYRGSGVPSWVPGVFGEVSLSQ